MNWQERNRKQDKSLWNKKKKLCSRQNCVDRLDLSEEAVPKLSNCLTSERAIPNYMMRPHVLGTPTPSSSLYAVLMKYDFVCIITDKERARFDLELQLNPKHRLENKKEPFSLLGKKGTVVFLPLIQFRYRDSDANLQWMLLYFF